jgi:small subunit ribosomal protein S3
MGQKIIPISLRLNKRKNWESKWIVEKNEYSFLFYLDLEIRKYFLNLINNKEIELINLNIKKKSNNINIYIYLNHKRKSNRIYSLKKKNSKRLINKLNLYYPNYYFKIFIIKVKINKNKKERKYFQKIFNNVKRRYRINFYNKQMIYSFTYAFFTKNINIILILIKKLLENKKIHKKLIKNINNILEIFFILFSNILGYKLQFKGRLNGYRRKKKIIYQKGKIPLNTLKFNIKYNFNEFKTPSGICSIKLWIFLKD